MFERYTERARRVLFFGRYEASQLGSIAIKSEHLLLGLIREGKGLTSRIFARHHISLAQVSSRIQAQTTLPNPVATSVEIPFSTDTKMILQWSADEADRLRHNYIGTEHLLLGILRQEQSTAASILTEMGLSLQGVRDEIVSLLAEKVTIRPENEVQVVPTSDEHVVVSRDVFRHLPSYLPSRTLHVSFSSQTAVGDGWFESPRHWIMLGAELESVIARAYGVDEAIVSLPELPHLSVFWSPPERGPRYDVVLGLPRDEPPEAIARIVQQAIEEQFEIVVTREPGPGGERLVVKPRGEN